MIRRRLGAEEVAAGTFFVRVDCSVIRCARSEAISPEPGTLLPDPVNEAFSFASSMSLKQARMRKGA